MRREVGAGWLEGAEPALGGREDLARPRVLRLGGGWAGPRGIHRASSTAKVNKFPANLWALESPD